MHSRKRVLLSTTMVPLLVFAGVAAGGVILTQGFRGAPAYAQCAAKKANPCNPCNPCAAKKANPCNPCNPCAAKKANPCAAAACNPCNPCGAAGGGAASKACVVPRLQTAAKSNPCAAKKACNPCNPCAAKAANPCNPCAVKKANPCNPCAAKAANPCNPCAAKAANPCNPCAAKKANPCNPCAAKAVNPCNPCAVKKAANPCAANPCNPCAVKKANPCNPCGAAANPCNPCGAAAGATDLSDAEAVKVYDCLLKEMKAAYAKSDNKVAVSYSGWSRYSKLAYVSDTHGARYVQNYANDTGRAYGNYEKAGTMPAGTGLAKDSFSVTADGKVMVGPLFVMEKMKAGFNAESGDWRYTMIMPDGSVFGTTKGAGADKVAFCVGCHISVAPDADSMMFLPKEYRVAR